MFFHTTNRSEWIVWLCICSNQYLVKCMITKCNVKYMEQSTTPNDSESFTNNEIAVWRILLPICPESCEIQCGAIIKLWISESPQLTSYSSAMWARHWVSSVSSSCDLCSSAVIVVLDVLSCYDIPCYDGTQTHCHLFGKASNSLMNSQRQDIDTYLHPTILI